MEGDLDQTLYILMAASLALAPGLLLLLWFRWRRWGGPVPISPDHLRGAGDTLRSRIARIDDRIIDLLIPIFLVPSVAVAFFLGANPFPSIDRLRTDYLPLAVFLALFLAAFLFFFNRRLRERIGLTQSLDAELAVGRELSQLVSDGFLVFHDFPAGRCNIDHVLVGASGIYAVETKGRPKPNRERVVVDAKVIYDGEALFFPDNAKETAAIARARHQAETLSGWLGEALGEPVPVQPALALPGWFVERRKPDDLCILYGRSSHYARILKGSDVLGEELRQRVVEQLEEGNRGAAVVAAAGREKMQGGGSRQ